MSINGYSEWWGWDGIRRLYLYRKERRKEGRKEGRKEALSIITLYLYLYSHWDIF